MKASDIPDRIPTPWAENADPLFITPIPQTTTIPGRASYEAGFGPINMQPIAAGGVPPFGQDFNGAFNQWTAWLRWQGAGANVAYNAAFSAAIGGYPIGATLLAANLIGFWFCQVDDNTSNPDAAGAGWLFVPITQTYAGNPNSHLAGTVGPPPSTAWDSASGTIWVCTTTGNAGAAVWRPLPFLTPITIFAGASRSYTATDDSRVYIRSNSGAAMTDSLPNGTIANGWNMSIINSDVSGGTITITAPGSRSLNGVVGGSLALHRNQSVTFVADVNSDFWMTSVPIPLVFSQQAVYVNSTQTLVPGVYDIDTRAGGFTITLQAGGVKGDNYFFRDVGGALAEFPCIVDPNGATVDGFVGTYPLDTAWMETVLSYNPTDWETI